MRLVAELQQLIEQRHGRVVVGITGPPGVGKSTVARRAVEAFGGAAAYLPMDGFHLSNAQLDRRGRRSRKGAPDTFDVDGFVATLRRVAAAHLKADVYVPDFDRAIEEPVAAGPVVPADARLVVTEGNYLGLPDGGWEPVRSLLDRFYYLDCPPAERRRRLVERHVAGGRSPAAAAAWVDTVDEPNAVLIAATQSRCDETIVEG